jgi:tetratricopeptide (TPR) repeat protein
MIKNAALKSVFGALLLLLFALPVSAQYSAKEQKAIDKSKQLYNDGKYDKAISTIKKVQATHYKDGELWQLRCLYEKDRYDVQWFKDIMSVINGKKSSSFKSTGYYTEMIVACYLATLNCEGQTQAGLTLHENIIAPSTDTAVSDDAKEQYSKGSDEYSDKNYTAAIRYFEKAIKEDSTYYKATVRMGLCYYKDEKYEKAIPWLRKAILLEPLMLTGHDFLIQALIETKDWQGAYDACVDAIISYPYDGYFEKMTTVCDKMGKTFDRHWMSRDYLPNIASSTTQGAISETPWSYYREAKNKIGDYCNDDGMIKKSQDLTQMKHMECYSWEYMLKKAGDDEKGMSFPVKMRDAGYLDCYAMVSMFHISFWDQYKDFSSKNTERMRQYINTQLVK